MANETKATPGSGATNAPPTNGPQPATLAQIRKATNAIVDALETMARDDQLRALEGATAMLGLRRKNPNQGNQQSGAPQGRGGRS